MARKESQVVVYIRCSKALRRRLKEFMLRRDVRDYEEALRILLESSERLESLTAIKSESIRYP
jgi:hypothetical protein